MSSHNYQYLPSPDKLFHDKSQDLLNIMKTTSIFLNLTAMELGQFV